MFIHSLTVFVGYAQCARYFAISVQDPKLGDGINSTVLKNTGSDGIQIVGWSFTRCVSSPL